MVLSALAAAGLCAQQPAIGGPVTGYVFDGAAGALRPILGLPGASLFGDPLGFGFNVSKAFVAPRQDAAFAIAADGSSHFFRVNSGAVTEITVNGLANRASQVAFSPTGNALAVFASGSVEVLTGLPDAPSVAGGMDLSEGTVPDALAVSDDGNVVLISANTSVHLFGSSNDMGKLMDTAGPALLAFRGGSHDAAIGDPSGAGIVLYRDLTGANTAQVLAAPDSTITNSSAVAFSVDGNTLLAASYGGQSVTTFDLTAGTRNSIACSCSPKSLARMGSLFRLNELGSDPLWLLDTSVPRIVFVPALTRQSASSSQ